MKKSNLIAMLGAIVLGIVIPIGLWTLIAQNGEVPDTVGAAGTEYSNCRLGVGVIKNPVATYPGYSSMHFGWYIDWKAPLMPLKPSGIDFYFTLRANQMKSGSTYLPSYIITPALSFDPGGLGPIVQANPGGVWLIGNEPDRPYSQDDVLPDMYARIYHDAYTFIKGIDPTARVANGAIVQPTPLRLQYLDMVLDAYRMQYGGLMPLDLFNTHAYMINEEKLKPGADIPPGITATVGVQFTPAQHLDINTFSSLIQNLRTWMKAKGYQSIPLIVTEYGALLPLWYLDDFGLTQGHINNYISGVMNWLNTTSDMNTGYPADGYRLLQQAALFSLDDDSEFPDPNPPETLFRWGSFLYRSTAPYTLTATGAHYSATAATLAATVDLQPYLANTYPGSLIVSPTGKISPTFNALIANAGNSPPPISVTVRFVDVTSGMTALGDVALQPWTGCGTLRQAEIIWPNLGPGLHTMRIEVDPGSQILETSEANNVMTATIFVGTYGVYLPSVRK